ncbi:MAG: 3'-5' exonuclease [Vicingaceae bacterium]|nr:MAG: 3'-5' exonuclease [Vicingaceae bacterium]
MINHYTEKNIKSFTAIDFETSCRSLTSICQIGLVHFIDNQIAFEYCRLVKPPGNYFQHCYTLIHDITPEHTASAPTFDQIWQEILPYIQGQHVVAHNGFVFDFKCLNQTLSFYGLPIPEYIPHDTYRIYRRGLKTLSDKYKLPHEHHDALSDAKVCGWLFAKYLTKIKN